MYKEEYEEQHCMKCGVKLTTDEIALHMKMINRGATEFMCINCLAEYFGTTVDDMQERIEHFRKQGCKLFQ